MILAEEDIIEETEHKGPPCSYKSTTTLKYSYFGFDEHTDDCI